MVEYRELRPSPFRTVESELRIDLHQQRPVRRAGEVHVGDVLYIRARDRLWIDQRCPQDLCAVDIHAGRDAIVIPAEANVRRAAGVAPATCESIARSG